MLASITLGAQQAPVFSINHISPSISGEHWSGRYSGKYELSCPENTAYDEVHIPSRDKHLEIFQEGIFYDYASMLSTLDSSFTGDTWYSKLERIRANESNTAIVNTKGTHGSLSILTTDIDVLVLGLYDPQLRTSHLLLSTVKDIEYKIRQLFPLRFYFYRFPVLSNNSLFIPTQSICSHWFRYCKSNDYLFAFNALEQKLFR